MSVYYAKRQQGDAGAAGRDGPGRNAKLYFTGMPPGLAREAMLKLFSAHGRVRHLQLYADDGGALTSGTVTMFSRSEAAAAMDALDGIAIGAPLPGLPAPQPLKVAWAQLNVLPKAQQSEVAGATVAYGAVPPGTTPHEVRGAVHGRGRDACATAARSAHPACANRRLGHGPPGSSRPAPRLLAPPSQTKRLPRFSSASGPCSRSSPSPPAATVPLARAAAAGSSWRTRQTWTRPPRG